MRELVMCGSFNLNEEELPIYCDSETGTCYYQDKTQGGTYEILGLEAEFPLYSSLSSTAFDLEAIRKHVAGAFGTISTRVALTAYVLYEDESGHTLVSKFRWSSGAAPIMEAPTEINMHVESEMPLLEYGDGDSAITYLKNVVGDVDEETLHTYIFCTLILFGVTPEQVRTESKCENTLADLDVATLAKMVKNPRVVVDYVRLMYRPDTRCSKNYLSAIEGDRLYQLAGC